MFAIEKKQLQQCNQTCESKHEKLIEGQAEIGSLVYRCEKASCQKTRSWCIPLLVKSSNLKLSLLKGVDIRPIIPVRGVHQNPFIRFDAYIIRRLTLDCPYLNGNPSLIESLSHHLSTIVIEWREGKKKEFDLNSFSGYHHLHSLP